jgi:excinuclease ABC subunit C
LIKDVTSNKRSLGPDLVLPSLQQNVADEQLTHLRGIVSQYLQLPKSYPLARIETYDVSNTQGTNATVAMVTFTNGRSDPSEYRLFNIRTLNTPNDFEMLKEALSRRQNHDEWGIPQLVIIDGGRGQLRAVFSIWSWPVPLMSIAKNPDRLIFPIIDRSGEKPKIIDYHIVKLPPSHPALKLVQQTRDEAHRFSKKQHSRLRTKNLLGQLK